MKTRVLIVDDSLTVRKHIYEVLDADPDLEVVGEAGDGRTAVELVSDLRPDVVTLDMMLPVMSGIAVTEYVMAYFPTPILVVSASTNRGALFRTYDALAAGAVDVFEKPPVARGGTAWERELVRSVKRTARIRVIRHPRARFGPAREKRRRESDVRLCAIGASTGGPGALLTVLRSLPADFPLPLLAVVHISEPFAEGLAAWLDGETEASVRLAQDGDAASRTERLQVLLAPAGRHLEVAGGELRLTDGPERHSCRPSVDVLFESIARDLGPRGIGCLMTGMGRDGAAGLLAMRRADGVTLAQDEASSVIYGMPREAARLDAAEHIVPLEEIGPLLAEIGGASKGVQS